MRHSFFMLSSMHEQNGSWPRGACLGGIMFPKAAEGLANSRPAEVSGAELEERESASSSRAENSERELHPQLHHAAASRTDEGIASGDVGCGAPAAERAGGPHVIGSTRSAAIAIRCAVRIGNDGVIEDVKDFDPKLGAVPLLEPEGLEYGEIHVSEARVAEDVPAHRAKGSPLGRNHNRLAGYVAPTIVQRTGVGGNRHALGPHRGGSGGRKEALHAGDAAGYTATVGAGAGAVGNGTRAGLEVAGVPEEVPAIGVIEA